MRQLRFRGSMRRAQGHGVTQEQSLDQSPRLGRSCCTSICRRGGRRTSRVRQPRHIGSRHYPHNHSFSTEKPEMCCKLPSQALPASRCESPTNRRGQALMGLNTLANMLSASEGPCHSHEPRWRAVCYHGLSTTTQVPTKACALGY